MIISLNIIRKPTFTGFGLNFLSYIPHIYKFKSLETHSPSLQFEFTWANIHTEAIYFNYHFIKFSHKSSVITANKDIKYMTIYGQS